MSDAAIYDEELKGLETQVCNLIRNINSAPTYDQKLERYNKAQAYLKRLYSTHNQLKVEIRLLDGNEQDVYDRRCQTHLSRINELKGELQSQKIDQREGGNNSENSVFSSPAELNDGKDHARAAAQRVTNIQSSTLKSLDVTERLLGETEAIGSDAATKLRGQTEQIRQVNDNLDELDSDVNRAKKELNAFIRRMMTDKIIICFTVLILIGIIVIVVLKVTKKSQ